MVSSGRGKKTSILGGPSLGQHWVSCTTLCRLTLVEELHGPGTNDGDGDVLLKLV
jgi:hypothetical protein